MVSQRFPVIGMTCASCAISLETYLKDLEGLNSIQVNYASQQVELTYNSDVLSLEALSKRAKDIGYEILVDSNMSKETLNENTSQRLSKLKKRFFVAVIFSVPVFIFSMFFMNALPYQNYVLMLLSVPVLTYSGATFFENAWKRIKHGAMNMDTLVALSTGIAFLYSVVNTAWPKLLTLGGEMAHVYYESAVVIITFILLGRYLEEKAKEKTTNAIQQLIGLSPTDSVVIRNGEEIQIKTKDIKIGDLIIVKPGAKIPVDGKVKKGASYVDESMLTGEPVAIAKNKGSMVIAGSVNQQGLLRVLAEKVGEETALAEMIRLVSKAQNSKPEIQKQVDKIAGVFVPVVIVIALIAACIWYWFGPIPQLQYAITTSITVLIVACPCALGLATPTALMVGIGLGSSKGILVRDAQTLETLHKTNTIILDKTGTLTEGKPVVVESFWINTYLEKEHLAVLLSIEKNSDHPLAKSIIHHYQDRDIEEVLVENFENKVGSGIKADVNGQTFYVGSTKMMSKKGLKIDSTIERKLKEWVNHPYSIVFFASEDEIFGLYAIGDEIKSSSKLFVESIKKEGVTPIILSGDNDATVQYVAKALSIDQYKGNQSPQDKTAAIATLQQNGNVVAMLGDGINDAAALTQADVGIAMGSGSDVAMESAGITLMYSDLNQVTQAFRLSKATIKSIRQNLFWAFIYNLIAIPIAAGVLYPINGFLLHPMIAGAAMSLSSVSVLLNSLRLKKVKI
ncbi:MAG: Cu2+-exporting ATPase [Bacteroidia bacterium]|jgi:Cu2+-exporting ATPase